MGKSTELKINFVKSFTDRPFGRYRTDDEERSAEVFRDDIFIPALEKYEHVILDLSDTLYYGSGFIEEITGGLVRKGYSEKVLFEKLDILHDRLPSLVEECWEYIAGAERWRIKGIKDPSLQPGSYS